MSTFSPEKKGSIYNIEAWVKNKKQSSLKTRVLNRFRLVYKFQLVNNLSWGSYGLVDVNFRAPDW